MCGRGLFPPTRRVVSVRSVSFGSESNDVSETERTPTLAPAPPTPRRAPLWHVVLLDDDDHTYEYVIEMLMKLFHHTPERAYEMACEVDSTGRVIVETTVLE
ncbi:MAG: ATP-dependent Clp protease adaptor ClpS, partial [Planctomycetota bacterium]